MYKMLWIGVLQPIL